MYINNHTAVWGSWYSVASGEWGYACCHATVHASYCAGIAGIEANEASSASNLLAVSIAAASTSASASAGTHSEETETPSTSRRKDRDATRKDEPMYAKKRLGEEDVQLDQERLAEAIKAERKRRKNEGDEEANGKKRKYNSNAGTSYDVTEEELGECFCCGFVLGLF